jgi:hypothetical protein
MSMMTTMTGQKYDEIKKKIIQKIIGIKRKY